MAYWGQAYAIGPNYNKDWDAFEPQELPDSVQAPTQPSPARVTWRALRQRSSDR